MQTDLSIYNSLRPSFIEGVHAVKFNALSAVISRYRDYARSSEQIKAYSGDSLLMRDIASLLDEAPRPITREYQDFTPFLLLLMLSEEFHAVHYVERLVTWYFGYCCVDELRTVCTILFQCSYPHHDTLRLRFKNYLREARKTLGMPVECNAAVMLKMLDASYEHLTPADVGEFEELLHLGDDYEFISHVKSNYLASDNVTELAGVCGYSSTITFRRRFQRVFGCSASSWLRQRRIERIGELLRTTHYTLQEIAYMCGFSAQSHFTDFCKRNMGSNPTSIRQEGRI
ncbi:helix-turn-helix transcriptional regulator [Bacteroides uniformis]|uniref:helix-turn-helix transcriptional regulator n=1 Tax=Bacteroides uniformis TaxID=820 RepID=UPI00233EC768|nr:helix-turn-helix transcriptional regulator [Bacteroides uniformis]MDC1844687.1 helix-turn-helix transcriptional regulator [Bacteroides uniformis]